MKKIIAIIHLAAALLAPALSHGKVKPNLISDAYAKQLAREAVKQQRWGKNFPYKITMKKSANDPFKRTFVATVNWGNRPHIQIAVPSYTGDINMAKKAKVKGDDRVRIYNRNP